MRLSWPRHTGTASAGEGSCHTPPPIRGALLSRAQRRSILITLSTTGMSASGHVEPALANTSTDEPCKTETADELLPRSLGEVQ